MQTLWLTDFCLYVFCIFICVSNGVNTTLLRQNIFWEYKPISLSNVVIDGVTINLLLFLNFAYVHNWQVTCYFLSELRKSKEKSR